MNPALIASLVQVGALATETLLEYLRQPPANDADAAAQDRATVALMQQSQRIGDVLRERIGVPDQALPSPPPDGLLDDAPTPALEGGREAPAVDNRSSPLRALAATLWGECRGEPRQGKIAVAWVVRNRAATPAWWGRDIVSVCTASNQFTCWHDRQAPQVRAVDASDSAFAACLEVARSVLAGEPADPTGGADHYHVAEMERPPAWSRGRSPVCRIGRHLFYRIGPAG